MLGQEDRRPGPGDMELSSPWQKGARPKLCTAGWDLKSSVQGNEGEPHTSCYLICPFFPPCCLPC